ncbi:unnamed protein product [Cylicocyclus nassatus]|uniref:Uncharacterized protein n=1 Tax=Cylicocyclus nassatus TaxID=53992 RepID=A0AA36HCR9_CYLNA|nr:unnamed protein product [Cylicocyclus nassatus]
MDFTWDDFVHVICMIAVVVFIVGTLMLALYVLRLICTFNQLPIFDVESSARSETLRSDRDQSVRSRRSLRSARSPSRTQRKRGSTSKSRSSLRSGSLSRSEREEAPRWTRRGTRTRSGPLRSEQVPSIQSEQESEGRTVNVVVRRLDIKPLRTKQPSQEFENVPKTRTRIQGVDIPRQTLKSGTVEEDEAVVPRTKGPKGVDLPRVTIRAGEADDDEEVENAPKGRIRGIDIPRETIRGAAGEEATKPNLTFNVEPGASISVNVLSERAYAGGGEGECIQTSESISGSDTLVCKTISSLTVTKI